MCGLQTHQRDDIIEDELALTRINYVDGACVVYRHNNVRLIWTGLTCVFAWLIYDLDS